MKPPVFVGGIARSGTTLMQMMLDSHPAIACGVEISERAHGACLCLKHGACESCSYYLSFLQAACGLEIELIVHLYRLCEMAIGPDYAKDEESRLRFIAAFYESLGLEMALRRKASRWGFKVMHAFQYADALLRTFPGIKLIHVVRDPLDVYASWKGLQGQPGSISVNSAPAAAAKEWVDVVGAWKPEYGLLVRYEQIVCAPRATMSYVLNWLGEEWDEAVLAHERAKHTLFETDWKQPSREQVKQAIHLKRISRWQQDLSRAEVDAWLAVGGELRWKMGYA